MKIRYIMTINVMDIISFFVSFAFMLNFVLIRLYLYRIQFLHH